MKYLINLAFTVAVITVVNRLTNIATDIALDRAATAIASKGDIKKAA